MPATDTSLSRADDAAVPLPVEARMSRGALLMAWASICSAMVYLFLGATLALSFGVRNAVIGMVLAVVVFGFLCGYLARFAATTGMSSSVLSQFMLGKAGGSIATLILSATGVYYAVFEGSVLAVAIHKAIPQLSYAAAAFVVVAYSVPLILGSVQNWIDRLNGVLLPFYLVGIAALIITSFVHHSQGPAFWSVGPASGTPPFGWWYCFATYLGVLVMVMVTMDFARFGRPDDAAWHARITFGMPFYAVTYLLNGIVGILIVSTLDAATVTETAVVDASLVLLGTLAGLGWVFVSQTRINTANFLLGTLNLQAFLREALGIRLSKAWCAAVVGLATFGLMRSTDIFKYLVVALNWQAVFTTAWVGVALSHVALVRQGRAPSSGNPGLISWVLGAFAGGTILAAGARLSLWYPVVTVAVSVMAHRVLLIRQRSSP
ncbi:MAG: hypothetical protein U1F35_11640 [Steroidobacteraceae bacterium]